MPPPIMAASRLKDPDDRTSTGAKVRHLYCTDCGRYAGRAGVCRVCERGFGEFVPPEPPERSG